MIRRNALALFMASALIAVAIAAAAFAFSSRADTTQANTVLNIQTETAEPLLLTDRRTTQPTLPSAASNLTRPAVDWAAVYARAIPSFVSIRTNSGAGSGFFVTESGHIITNLHVVDAAAQIVIVTQGGQRLEAELIARDAGNDLALLKIDPADVAIVVPEFGELDELRTGDPVAALGDPFWLSGTLTVGIVSALNRDRTSGSGTWEPLRNMIQTDATLNPGNSGGMLLDEHGRVIGIPTQIETPDGIPRGIGFAVPIDALLRSLPTMLTGEDAQRSYLGVSLDTDGGSLTVSNVSCDSAAADAGIRRGDEIRSINGQPADSYERLVDVLAGIAPGEEITITVQRGSRTLTLETEIGGWPTERPLGGCG